MRRLLKALLAGLLAGVVFPPAAGAETKAQTLPAGSTLKIRLTTTLTSKTNKTGDPFTGVVQQPLVVNGKTLVPEGSQVSGHMAFIKPPGRFKGPAEMRIVLDRVMTPDDVTYSLAGSLEDAQGGPCASTGKDDEGTIVGCGKSKKDAAKSAAMGGVIGAGLGASVGIGHEIDCQYYGNCGGPGMGTDVLTGAGIGAATGLIFTLFKHEKNVILLEGMHLTFIVNRSIEASEALPPASPTSK